MQSGIQANAKVKIARDNRIVITSPALKALFTNLKVLVAIQHEIRSTIRNLIFNGGLEWNGVELTKSRRKVLTASATVTDSMTIQGIGPFMC